VVLVGKKKQEQIFVRKKKPRLPVLSDLQPGLPVPSVNESKFPYVNKTPEEIRTDRIIVPDGTVREELSLPCQQSTRRLLA
jgi:hypothetical protein